MVSFLAGTLLSAILQKFTLLYIPQPLLLSAISLLIICSITFIRAKRLNFPHKSPNAAIILPIATLFMLGFANNQRPNLSPITNQRQYLSPTANSHAIKENDIPVRVRKHIASAIENLIPNPPDRAIVTALAIGEKMDIPQELKKAYRDSGAAHLLALSGMHAAVIYGIINLMLFFLSFSYKTIKYKILIASAFIFLFTYITGSGASVLRAAIMITIWKTLEVTGRGGSRWSAWLISACLILLIDPQQIYNIGFQLSFAAVAGIIALYPAIRSSLSIWEGRKCYRFIKPVWELAGISVACQIATAPFAWYYFNTAPTYFLITNLAAVPLSTLAIYSLAAAAITAPVPFLGDFTALFLQKSVWLLNYIIEFMGKIS